MELNIKRIGLSPIPTRSTTEPVADVVFVHGLMGHPRNTWSASDGQSSSEQPAGKPQKKSIFSKLRKPKTDAGHKDTAEPPERGVFWPSDFLARDLESARIFTYGYNADVVTGLFQSSNSNNIYEHTMTMAVRLKRGLEHHNVPIVFIVHSLGGVIVKDAINNSDFLRDRTKLVIFFGTPHNGSATAGWGELAGSFTRYFLFLDTNAGLVGDLDLNSQTLDRIHREFVRNIQASRIHIHSFQESRALGGTRTKIVENWSSRMAIGELETVESIDADHRNMAKFDKDTDEGYEAVRSILRSFVRQIIRDSVPADPTPAAPTQAPSVPATLVSSTPAPPAPPAPALALLTSAAPPPAAPTGSHHRLHDQLRGSPTPFEQTSGDDESQMTRSTDTAHINGSQPSESVFLNLRDHENIKNFWSDYAAARSSVVDSFPGTCEWVVQHADFQRWGKSGEVSPPLWISGHPGMGKTVMSKFLLDHFEHMEPPYQTLYFFFSDCDVRKNTALLFLKAAIHQLIQHSESLYQRYVKAKLAVFGNRLYDSLGMLWDMFFDMTQDTGLGPILCVIDGLDECEVVSRQELVTRIGKYFSLAFAPETSPNASKTFKILLTSRPCNDILANWARFQIIHLKAELEDTQINRDISLFVGSEVYRLARRRGYSEELQNRLCPALIQGAGGIFLWAALMVKMLETTPGFLVRERLASLPSGLDALYDYILAEVPEDLLATISTVLKWATFAYRPLSVDELGVACALDSSSYRSIASIPEEILTGIRRCLDLCGPIIKIDNDHLHLAHQTTKEYLIRRSLSDTAIGALLSMPRDAHSQLALACMRFINSAEVDIIVAEDESRYSQALREPVPFTDYAPSFWGSHVRETGTITEDDPLWDDLSLALKSTARLRWLAETTIECQQNLSRFEARREWREEPMSPGPSPIHILLDCECESASALYLRFSHFKASTKDAGGRNLLHMAVERGFHQVMVDLLGTEPEAANLYQRQKTEDRNIHSGGPTSTYYVAKTPLHIAAIRGDTAAIKILLRHQASVDKEEMREEYHKFSRYKYRSVVRARTALHCATAGNHMAAVCLLLDGSASIEASETKKEEWGDFSLKALMSEDWTALHTAASLGFIAISRLLLQRGAATVTGSDGEVYAPYEYTERDAPRQQHHGMKPQWPNRRVAVQGRLRYSVHAP